MSTKEVYFTASFGASKAGLSSVGYTIFDTANTVYTPRTTDGVVDLSNGNYGALIVLPSKFQGLITWDTGEDTPVFASSAINIESINCSVVQCSPGSVSPGLPCTTNIAATPGCTAYGTAGDIPAAAIMHMTGSDIYFPITTVSGSPAIIADGCPDPTIVSGAAEAVLRCGGRELEATFSATRAGIEITIPADLAPGVYNIESILYNDADKAVGISRGLLYVEPSAVFSHDGSGIPTIFEIRQAIRDFPNSRRLLGTYEFTVAEIAGAVRRTISKFNSFAPKVISFSSLNWPVAHSAELINGILAELYEMSAAYFRANYLPYSAGGLTIDDTVKEKDYLNATRELRQRWEEWVRIFKMGHNIETAFGSNTSFYYNLGY